MDYIDLPNVRIATLAAELGPANAFHISKRLVRRTPPRTSHRHEFFEVFWITTGSCTHFINGASEQLAAGTLVFIRPDDTHAFQNSGTAPCRMVNVAFAQTSADFLQDRYGCEFGDRFFWADSAMPPSFVLDQNGLNELARLEATLEGGARSLARIEAFLLRLITDLMTTKSRVPSTAPTWLSNACEAMSDPEALRQGVAFLVQYSNRSHEHVARTFRRYLDQTPSTWVNRMRMSMAARMLLDSDDPIIDVALTCGIDDLSHFYRLFRQVHGISPKKYRSRHQVDLVHPFAATDH